jgi:hypothetical protein
VNLELNAEALIRECTGIIQNDRYPLSPRIVALKEILGMMGPEPEQSPYSRNGITSRRANGRYSQRR